jgi:hypothetical protein
VSQPLIEPLAFGQPCRLKAAFQPRFSVSSQPRPKPNILDRKICDRKIPEGGREMKRKASFCLHLFAFIFLSPIFLSKAFSVGCGSAALGLCGLLRVTKWRHPNPIYIGRPLRSGC